MLNDADRDLAIRTIVGEANGQPFEGQQAVANVILNRLRSGRYGGSIADVVFAPYQFEPWQTRRAELMALQPNSPAYARAGQAVDAALGGDVTGGATHFLNPEIVQQRTGTLPAWAQGEGLRIGAHVFHGGTGATPSGGVIPAAQPTASSTYAPPTPGSGHSSEHGPDTSDIGTVFRMAANPPQLSLGQAGGIQLSQNGQEPTDFQGLFDPRTTQRTGAKRR